MLIHDLLLEAARRWSDHIALTDDAGRYTYRQLAAAAGRFATELVERELQVGDRVVVYLPNSFEAVTAAFGIWAAGGCCVIVDPATPTTRLLHIVQHCGAGTIVAAEAICLTLDQALPQTHQPRRLITAADLARRTRWSIDADGGELALNSAWPKLSGDDLAAIIYTSGSTGQPKGVTHVHRSVLAVVEAVAEYLEHDDRDVVLSVLQLAFGYGLLQLLVTVARGGRLVLRQGMGFPKDILRTLESERITGLAGVPTLFARLLEARDADGKVFPQLRYLTNAAAALPPSFVPRLRSMFPNASLYLMYGQTECLRASFLQPDQCEVRPGSVGRGMANVELWLEDDRGRRVPRGGEGELVVSGPGVMIGYWNDTASTDKVLRPGRRPGERTLRTGDIFRTDADGYLYFVSRLDEIIKCCGEKVSPIEVEEAFYELPEVLEVRVIGVPDEVLGHALRAEVVPRAGHEIDLRRIRAHLRSRLEGVKIPQEIVMVESIPKTLGGKVKRRG